MPAPVLVGKQPDYSRDELGKPKKELNGVQLLGA